MSSFNIYLIGIGLLAKADNTVRENKNNCGIKMMTMLLGKSRLKVGGLLYGPFMAALDPHSQIRGNLFGCFRK